jgi:hypothetical protein
VRTVLVGCESVAMPPISAASCSLNSHVENHFAGQASKKLSTGGSTPVIEKHQSHTSAAPADDQSHFSHFFQPFVCMIMQSAGSTHS